MASPIEEAIDLFVEQIFANQTLSQNQRKEIITNAMFILAGGITDGTRQWGISMALGKLEQEAKKTQMKIIDDLKF